MALPTRVNRTAAQYDPMETAQREFDTLMGRLLGRGEASDGGYLAPYGVDVREDQDHLYVEAELPGFKKDEIDITLENQTLTISAERKSETTRGNSNGGQKQEGGNAQKSPSGDWLLRERRYSRFARSFTLPPTVDEQAVDAKLQDGVLTITLNKREETKPRKVRVS